MQEASIHLPENDNAGVSLMVEADKVSAAILEAFGGYSAQEARGAWRDPADGKVYVEPVTRITIAADWEAPGMADKLLEIAAWAAGMMRQVCVYVSLPGGVEFVEPVSRKAA